MPARGRRYLSGASGVVGAILGGWDTGLLNYWQSGTVFDISSGRDTGPNPNVASFADYTGDRIAGQISKEGGGVFYFDQALRSAFTFPAAGTIGTSGRNAFRGPRNFNVDITFSKRFRVGFRLLIF